MGISNEVLTMIIRSIISVLLVITALSGCRVDEEFDGPSLNDLYGDFAVISPLQISNDPVDFSTGETTAFTAEFTKNISWTLRITGLETGAIKEISDFSNTLDASNATWNGTTTLLPMFRPELCAVELTFDNEPDTLRDTVLVTGVTNHPGLLLSDFESGTNPGWITFSQSGANMSFTIDDEGASAQGTHYFDIGGTVNWDWLIALIHMPAVAYGGTTFNLSENPAEVFFNSMLFKPSDLNNGIMLFQFREDDNGDGAYSNNEDMYSYEIAMAENGWNQYSIRYADIPTLINGQPAAALGNGIHEPHKLMQVSALFLANPNSGYANAYLDYLLFTEGSPLIP